MDQLLLFEEERPSLIAGTDEAGRGPLAGPVYAACVVLPKDFPVEILDDSKKLSEKRRLEAEKVIKERAIWAVAFCTHREIDDMNILQASMLAMRRAFLKVQAQTKVDVLYADGNRRPDVDVPCQAIVKGDSKVPEIMAASILAKCERDRFMKKAAVRWPGYGFERNMGYPTQEHRKALHEKGPTPIHRLTFSY